MQIAVLHRSNSSKSIFSRFICFFSSILTLFTLSADMDLQEGSEGILSVLEDFQSVHIADIVILGLLYRLYRYVLTLYRAHFTTLRARLYCHIPAFLFSSFMILGYSFFTTDSWELVFGSSVQLLKSCVAFAGWYALFFGCTVWLFHAADQLRTKPFSPIRVPRLVRLYLDALKRYPFRTCFLTLLAAYLPYVVISYPGIFTHDTRVQLENAFQGMDQTVTLRNQHPIVHSLTMWLFASMGQTFFSSMNTSMFLYSLFQLLLIVAAMSWTVKLLFELNAPGRAVVSLMLLFILSPITQNYLFTDVKDAPFCGFLMLFAVQIFRVLTERLGIGRQKACHYLLLAVSALGMFFFRQDGVYQLLITLAVLLIANRKNRRLWACMGASFLCLFVVWNSIALPALDVRPSSRREMLSIPFQQTARYIRDAGDQVTEEEAAAISAILDYENLGELYNPNLSDPVKGTFNDDASGEDLAGYFRVWFQMLLKRPDIYVQATMNNVYGYFYPDGHLSNVNSYGESEEHMADLNQSLKEYGADFHYPGAFGGIRILYENFRDAIFSLPVLSFLRMPAFYVWSLLLCFFYCLARQKRKVLYVLIPMLVSVLICIAGPAYGWYFRYLFAISLCLPGVVLMGIYSEK